MKLLWRFSLSKTVQYGAIVIRPARKVRDGWETAAAECRAANDDKLTDWEAAVNDFVGGWA